MRVIHFFLFKQTHAYSLFQIIVPIKFGQFLLKKNKLTCERNTVKIDKKENIQDIFIDLL